MKCEYCIREKNKYVQLKKIDRRNELAELDEDATDGQMADYLGAELSGENGAWNLGIVEYECPECKRIYQTMGDQLYDYRALIFAWHMKAAREDDYFSMYVFEYLAFIAYLKNVLFWNAPNDRMAIQRLKQSKDQAKSYLELLENDRSLSEPWVALIQELGRCPLYNTSRDYDTPEIDDWWNNSNDKCDRNQKSQKGIVRSLDDWENMVEFWYAVRNNLFHGGKDPSIERDRFLVEHAYRTMTVFMENEIKKL
jgi:hypothetical protein